MEVAEYVLGTQNRKLIIFLQYVLRKECHSCFCVLYDAKHKGMCAIFQKKGKYLKIWAKMYKTENAMKKGSLMCVTIASMKQLEYSLNSESVLSQEWVELWSWVFCRWWGRNHTFIQSFQVDVIRRTQSDSKQFFT